MARSGRLGLAACALAAIFAALCHAEKSCQVTVRYESGRTETYVEDGSNSIELHGENCNFKGKTPSSGALVCFLYSALIIMPVLYFLSVQENCSEYTWSFLDNFMGIFIAILWWSCFDESFAELEYGGKVVLYVLARNFVVPGVLLAIADSEHLFGIASVLKHVVCFMAVQTGAESLKYANCNGPPNAKMLVICLLQLFFNLALWKLKHVCTDSFLKPPKWNVGLLDRMDEVFTELGLDAGAMSLAAMLFLSMNTLYFKKTENFMKDADLSMGNEHLFDTKSEGEFAALFALTMMGISITMEHFGGNEHAHQTSCEHEDDHAEIEDHKVALCLRKDGTVNGIPCKLSERVVVSRKLTARNGRPSAEVDVVSPSILDRPSPREVLLADLKPVEEETLIDYVWHIMQLTLMSAAAWSSVTAVNYLVRTAWFPFLLKQRLEGSLFVSVMLMFFSGFVIIALSFHAACDRLVPGRIMKYFRVHFLRAVSLTAALSWDMTFDAAVQALPIRAIENAFGLDDIPEMAVKLTIASLMTCFIAPIYVVQMRPSIARAEALLEHMEKDDSESDEKAKIE